MGHESWSSLIRLLTNACKVLLKALSLTCILSILFANSVSPMILLIQFWKSRRFRWKANDSGLTLLILLQKSERLMANSPLGLPIAL